MNINPITPALQCRLRTRYTNSTACSIELK